MGPTSLCGTYLYTRTQHPSARRQASTLYDHLKRHKHTHTHTFTLSNDKPNRD